MNTYECWHCGRAVDSASKLTVAATTNTYDVCESCYMQLSERDSFTRLNSAAQLANQTRLLSKRSAPLGNARALAHMPIHGPDIVDYTAWRDRLELLLLAPDVYDPETGSMQHTRINSILCLIDSMSDKAEKQRSCMREEAAARRKQDAWEREARDSARRYRLETARRG